MPGYCDRPAGLRYPEAGLEATLKRTIDVVGACLGLIVLAPVFAVLALLIKCDSPGTVFYRRLVIGHHGRPVAALKFRTMYSHRASSSDQSSGSSPPALELTQVNDPRITPLGAVLRRTSLDELPQLWNVFKGEMSLIGPRMITAAEYESLDEFPLWQTAVVHSKPALTGLWQVSGRKNRAYADRVTLDLDYLYTWSLWGDIVILVSTLPAVLTQRGAY